MRHRRLVAVIAAGLMAGVVLSGCSMINTFLHDNFPDHFGPLRGDDGRVSSAIRAHSYYLEAGDCFNIPDSADQTEVILVPCSDDHQFEAIGQGEVTLQEQKTLGMQNAVSAKCAEPFEAFRAAAPVGTRPDQQFIISEEQRDGRIVTEYICAAALTKL